MSPMLLQLSAISAAISTLPLAAIFPGIYLMMIDGASVGKHVVKFTHYSNFCPDFMPRLPQIIGLFIKENEPTFSSKFAGSLYTNQSTFVWNEL